MDFIKLKNLADKNEVRIDNHKGHTSNPAYYYDSLRNAFGFYFNTFITKNASYESYITATSTDKRKALKILESQFLDAENTVLSLVSFERFFELFLKDLLNKTNPKLSQSESGKSKSTWQLISKIQLKTFQPFIPIKGKGAHKIPFRETLKRFYDLIDYSKDPIKKSNKLVKKFLKIINNFTFLDNKKHKATLEFLNWYRDRILHSGNKLPRLRFLDYTITQRVIPIVCKILAGEEKMPTEWLFFTETVTGIKILDCMMNTKFEVRNLKSNKKIIETINNLLFIGHLKELGRANMNMNNAIRQNRATYEYNYHDPKGRGKRFAIAEKDNYPNAKNIKRCPCCNEESLVLYETKVDNWMGTKKTLIIQWIKCYTCEYHLRQNVFDLHFFNPKFEKLFDYQSS